MSITATLIVQMIVFAILVWFTMKFVWPLIAAPLDERARRIAEGLSAADKAKADLSAAQVRIVQQMQTAQDEASQRMANVELLARQIVDDAKLRANEESAKIMTAANAEAAQAATKAREALREQVAQLAVKGAEQILRREVDPSVHADLLNRLKSEL